MSGMPLARESGRRAGSLAECHQFVRSCIVIDGVSGLHSDARPSQRRGPVRASVASVRSVARLAPPPVSMICSVGNYCFVDVVRV
jgi:hypothetical protein